MKFLATIVAFATTMLLTSCEQIKSLADINLDTNYIVDIPVQLIKSDAQGASFSMSIASIDELKQYLDKLEGLTITDIELCVLNYQGDDYSGDLELVTDGATLWSREDVVASEIEPFRLKSDDNLNRDTLNRLAKKLLNKESVEGGLNVTSDSADPVSASFTVRCKFLLEITVNPLE